MESAPDAMVIANGDERIVLVNAQTENLLGNAWKFTSGREFGRISFGSDRKEAAR